MKSSSGLSAADSQPDGIELEVLGLIAKQARRTPLPIFVCMMVLAIIASRYIPAWMATLWLGVEAAVFVLRYHLLKNLHLAPGLSVRDKWRRLMGLNLLSAITHSCALLVFQMLTGAERAFFTVLLLGLCSGAIATMAGNTRALLAFIGPISLSLATVWAWRYSTVAAPSAESVISVLILGYAAVTLAVGRDVNRSIRDAWGARHREGLANAQLSAALAAAEDAGRTKARFLTAAGHDLRQPVAAINAVLTVLNLRTPGAEEQRLLGTLSIANQQLIEQLDSLIELCRLDASDVQILRRPVEISQLVTAHVHGLVGQAAAKNLRVECFCEPGVVLETDAMLFGHILRNLTHNALKFTQKGGVVVRLTRTELSVSDTGCGIAPSHQERVFEEFVQVKDSVEVEWSGLGLGLPIARRLAVLLGMRLTLKSELGVGSVFTLTWVP